jgi:hypothetical protein
VQEAAHPHPRARGAAAPTPPALPQGPVALCVCRSYSDACRPSWNSLVPGHDERDPLCTLSGGGGGDDDVDDGAGGHPAPPRRAAVRPPRVGQDQDRAGRGRRDQGLLLRPQRLVTSTYFLHFFCACACGPCPVPRGCRGDGVTLLNRRLPRCVIT